MFYWPKLMLETERIDARLAKLPPARTVAFATACAQHALLRFRDVWWQEHFKPSSSEFIPVMLEIIEGIWERIAQVEARPDVSSLARQVDRIVGPDYAE